MKIFSGKAWTKKYQEIYEDGKDVGRMYRMSRVEELERAIERKNKSIVKWQQAHEDLTEKTNREIEVLNNKVKVLEAERSEAAEVLRMKLSTEADKLENEARATYLDKREVHLGKLAESMKWDKAAPTQMQITSGMMPMQEMYQQRPY